MAPVVWEVQNCHSITHLPSANMDRHRGRDWAGSQEEDTAGLDYDLYTLTSFYFYLPPKLEWIRVICFY